MSQHPAETVQTAAAAAAVAAAAIAAAIAAAAAAAAGRQCKGEMGAPPRAFRRAPQKVKGLGGGLRGFRGPPHCLRGPQRV